MVKRVPSSLRVAIIEMIQAAHERDFERYVSASKRMGTVSYEAPEAELAEFTERMFDIFESRERSPTRRAARESRHDSLEWSGGRIRARSVRRRHARAG